MIVKVYPDTDKLVLLEDMKTNDLIVKSSVNKVTFFTFLVLKIVIRN